jgi:hypothetical protein
MTNKKFEKMWKKMVKMAAKKAKAFAAFDAQYAFAK